MAITCLSLVVSGSCGYDAFRAIDLTTSEVTPAWWPAKWPIALAWIAALTLVCLPLRDFWYPDEPDMARVSADMFTHGDYLQPYRMGKAFDDYPPLFYWVAGAFGRVGGWSELELAAADLPVRPGVARGGRRVGAAPFR